MDFLTVFVYIITTFALSELLVFYDGFLRIFSYIRNFLASIHPHLGELMSCIVCASMWVGMLLSLTDYFLIGINFTPFNIILGGSGLWYVIVFLDMCFTAGTTLLLYHLDEYMTGEEDNGEQ